MAQSRSFFDDVKRELECSVCQEQFSEINEPKILKCLHTFCKSCLEAWLRQQGGGALSCPTCRQITECSNNNINSLPSNLFYKQMVNIVTAYTGQGQEDSPHCGNCDERKPLKFYCSECNFFLCEDCALGHKKWKALSGHHVKEIGNFKPSDAQEYARKLNTCKRHNDEVRFYCEQCVICICRDCAILEHRDHNIVSLDKGLEKKKSEIEIKMRAVEANVPRWRNEKESLEKRRLRMKNSIKQATEEIHKAAERNIELIRQHEASVTERLLKHKETFESSFSSTMTGIDAKLMEIQSSLDFGNDVLQRNNLPEILNVEEVLERRFQELLDVCAVSMNVNFSAVKYVANDLSSLKDSAGKLFTTNTEPSLSLADGKGLTEGTQGEDCTFTVTTKDSQGMKTYSETDRVNVDIQSLHTRSTLKVNITDSQDGCYRVSYKPEAAGEFNVSVTVAGEAIKGSPFQMKVMEVIPNAKEGNEKNRAKRVDDAPKKSKENSKRNTNLGARKREEDRFSALLESSLKQLLSNGVNFSLYQSDITDERVDAIVNAANEWLQHGGGVAAAIVRKGGRQIEDESREIMSHRNRRPLNVGDAVYTSGGNLPCRFVIHTVGPRWHDYDRRKSISLLHRACVESLHLAAQLKLCSIALPAISSGIFGMPKNICAQVMFEAVEEFSSSTDAEFSALSDVRIVIIDDETIGVFRDEFVRRYISQETSQTNVTYQEYPPNEEQEGSFPSNATVEPLTFSTAVKLPAKPPKKSGGLFSGRRYREPGSKSSEGIQLHDNGEAKNAVAGRGRGVPYVTTNNSPPCLTVTDEGRACTKRRGKKVSLNENKGVEKNESSKEAQNEEYKTNSTHNENGSASVT